MSLHATLDRRRCLAAVASLVLPARGANARAEPVRVALVPYLSPRAMLTRFEPLQRHLEAHMGTAVEFYTATSFSALLESARSQAQPFTMLPVHMARIAVVDWGDTLVARSTLELGVVLLAPRSLGLTPERLAGRRIATIDPLSLTALMLRRWLVQQRIDSAVEVVHMANANSAALAISRGEAHAVALTQGQVLDIPWLKADELVPVAPLGSVMTPGFVAHRRVPAAQVAAFRRGLTSWPGGSSPAGSTSAAEFVDGSPRDLERFETFAADVRRTLPAAARQR